MGLYKMTDRVHNNLPVYQLRTKTSVLFVSNAHYWVLGKNLDSPGVSMFHPGRYPTSARPPLTGWLYDDGTGWRLDTSFEVISTGW